MVWAPSAIARRLHLVELEDLPWFPKVLRDGGTAFLALAERLSGHGRMMAGPLERALRESGETELLDLCSGGGGPASVMGDELKKRGLDMRVTLTDLYPNAAAFAYAAAQSGAEVRGRAEPLDATAVPADMPGFRTCFNAFHHLKPEAARKVLADAVTARKPIAVFEVVSREWPMLLGLLFAPLNVTLMLPLLRPFDWRWIMWTWVIPVMQPFILWDGVVSWLRIYSVPELQELVAGLGGPDWVWEIGTIKLGNAPLHGTYLIGRPRR